MAMTAGAVTLYFGAKFAHHPHPKVTLKSCKTTPPLGDGEKVTSVSKLRALVL